MEEKKKIILRMVENGYRLTSRTVEELENTFTVEELANMEKKFNEWRTQK